MRNLRTLFAAMFVVMFATAAAPLYAADAYAASGKVNSVDLDGAQVNITHGPIKGLGWPGMTMTFPVKERAQLGKIKPGEEVDFKLAKEGERYVITDIRPRR